MSIFWFFFNFFWFNIDYLLIGFFGEIFGTLLDVVATALQTLRGEGVLVIGSGFMTHGLPFMTSDMWLRNAVPAWSSEFDAWAAQALDAGDLDELAAYRNRAPGLGFAHPTVEHFTPLFVALGAGGGTVTTAIDGYQFGLAKRSIEVA